MTGATGVADVDGIDGVDGDRPWRGVVAALVTPFTADLRVDFDRLQEHVRWLATEGCDGFAVAGPPGEYQTLTDGERADVLRAVVAAAPPDRSVLANVSGYGSHQSAHWAEQAARAGADAVLALPPTGYRARPAEVVAHYREIAAAGLPVVAYNDPGETAVDLTPELMATVAEIDGLAAVQEASGDVRRLHRIRVLCPHVDVLAGVDDLVRELVVFGAAGWIGGLPNALPRQTVCLYRRFAGGDPAGAAALYATLYPLLSWNSRPESVQALKCTMEIAGRYGGPCRPPRVPLPAVDANRLRRDVERAVAAVAD
ncbi:dihydrodipicolinate synthase family protein [Polymorphospora sp. NPDC051019]|uniref:dihydrodipicolinate synthase family protein n=1 Tax=Polymorphospora sp. NPDC051019 TaxID=3155725 RepID=UPI003429A2C7